MYLYILQINSLPMWHERLNKILSIIYSNIFHNQTMGKLDIYNPIEFEL